MNGSYSSGLELITPTMAAKWLRECGFGGNRNIRPEAVVYLVRQIVGGHWRINGATIVFSDEGELLDGQHRLAAVVKSGVSVHMHVVRGVSAAAFSTMDRGRSRPLFTVVSAMGGLRNASALCAVSRLVYCWDTRQDIPTSLPKLSPEEINLVIRHYPEIVGNCAEFTRKVMRTLGMITTASFARWLFNQSDRGLADAFFHGLTTGENLGAGSAVLALRTRLIRIKDRKNRLTKREEVALFVRAWNAFNGGNHVRALPMSPARRDGVTREVKIQTVAGYNARVPSRIQAALP